MKTVAISDPKVYDIAIQILEQGGLVVVPSDTVYGLSVDATNKKAVQKLIDFKSRVPGKAISVFVGSMKRASEYVHISEGQKQLLESILPGAYTIVLPSTHLVAKEIESENGTLGIRIPDYEFNNMLVERFDKPVTATSANQAGRSPHSSVEALLKATPANKRQLIDLVIDGGKLPKRKPSTVVDFTSENFDVLRAGDVSVPMSKSKEYVSLSEDQTQKIAQELLASKMGNLSKKPLVFMLYGDLGTGKTVFVKGLGNALGISNIISPTFVVTYEYNSTHSNVDKLHHFDLYRVKDIEEFNYLGIDTIMKPKNVIAIEWSEKSKQLIKSFENKVDMVQVVISHLSDSSRKLEIY